MDHHFCLRFDGSQVQHWASRYTYPNEELVEQVIGPRARSQGYFNKEDFLTVCRWKSPRTQKRCDKNDEDFIRHVTKTALATPNERLQIEVLTLLDGVDWPTASVLLHFSASDRYPVLDFRALWSLGIDKPPTYEFSFWRAYTAFCRKFCDAHDLPMRVLDRALWQFSKENQPGGTSQVTRIPKQRGNGADA